MAVTLFKQKEMTTLRQQRQICTFVFRPSTLIEDTDLLVILLYHADVSNSNAHYFRSDKAKSCVYNIKVLKQVLGEEVCKDLLFLRACP